MRWISDNKLEYLRSIAEAPDFSQTKYRIVRELARGGMGTIYLADDPELDRQVAIKVLTLPEINMDIVRRLKREARIIARLEHPGIVPVHDVGVLNDGRVFYVMKFVRGSRLDEYAARTDSLNDRLRKFQAVCEAVAFAHARGVVHRDLKPQNIMIGSFGEVLVLDWGVAKLVSASDASEADTLMLPAHGSAEAPDQGSDTAQGTVLGTPLYMSPEQANGEIAQLDGRSDIYSLGAILYFLLTNKAPVVRKSAHRTAAADSLVRPREMNPRIGKAAEAVCLRAMARSSDDRYPTASDLSNDIARLLDAVPTSAYRENVAERVGRWLSKNRLLVFLILAYLVMRMFFILTQRR